VAGHFSPGARKVSGMIQKVYFVKIAVAGKKTYYKGEISGWKRSVEAFPLTCGYTDYIHAGNVTRGQIKAFRDDGFLDVKGSVITIEYETFENQVGEAENDTSDT
jgi:hypothetical protein